MGRRALREALIVCGLVASATYAVTRARYVPGAGEYVGLAVAVIFLGAALRLAQREPSGPRRFGIDLGGVLGPPSGEDGDRGLLGLARTVGRALPSALRELAVALGACTVVFPLFALGFWLWHAPSRPFQLSVTSDIGSFALAQVVLVGLPEEAFFRGWLQTRLSDAFPTRHRLAGVQVSFPALLLQAALFALAHFVVDFSPAQLAVFFPALVFGVLRSWRNGIGAPLLFHAACNVYSDTLARSWLG